MKKFTPNDIELIKTAVQEKFGPIIYPRDCIALSMSLLEAKQRNVSSTTLKRIWKFVNSEFKCSKYTIESLLAYAGYTSIEELRNKRPECIENFVSDKWHQLSNCAEEVTSFRLKSLINRKITSYKKTVERDFSKEFFQQFMNSDKQASVFVAPSGFGKSVIIAKIVERFFIDKEAPYSDSILLLMDGDSLSQTIKTELSLLHWITETLYPEKEEFNLAQFIINQSEQLDKYFVLIIDAVNEISYETEKLKLFAKNINKLLQVFDITRRFKLLLTCRTFIWSYISKELLHQRKHWFQANFDDDSFSFINVPLLNKREINKILQQSKSKLDFDKLRIHNSELCEILKYPYFINLFISHEFTNEAVSEIDLLRSFIQKTVLEGIFAEEKNRIINRILQLTEYGKRTDKLRKNQIPEINDYTSAYEELITKGVLCEHNCYTTLFDTETCVHFTHDILFEFFIVNTWLRQYSLSETIVEKIADTYNENLELQFSLIKWIIKFAFHESHYKFLKTIFFVIRKHFVEKSKTEESLKLLNGCINLIGCELRKYASLRRILLPAYAQQTYGQVYYFESFWDMDFLIMFYADSIEKYLQNNKSNKAQLFGHAIKFWKCLFSIDLHGIAQEYEEIEQIPLPREQNDLYKKLKMSCKIIFQHLIFQYVEPTLIDEAVALEEKIVSQPTEDTEPLSYFHLSLIDSFNICEYYGQVLILSKLFQIQYEQNERKHKSRFYQFFLMIYSKALLQCGHIESALEVFSKIDTQNLPANSMNFWQIRYNLIRYEFCILQQDHQLATEISEYITETAEALKLTYFIKELNKLEKKKNA